MVVLFVGVGSLAAMIYWTGGLDGLKNLAASFAVLFTIIAVGDFVFDQ